MRKTAIYLMGQCSDAEDYIQEFISFMHETYWIAHAGLQATIKLKKSKELKQCYQWMAETYKYDTMMQNNLKYVL